MSTDKALIAAGAVLPGAVEAGEDRDAITARHYTHPALDGRVVVRLAPEVLGRAEDLTCEYLGFEAPVRVAGVGTGRRSALGFPAWALVNDPKNAHHALNLVKEVERLARVAKSRAGAAKDGFTSLGDMLGRSAPHFLPTFYEQAGRIFLQHGNPTYAATMFGKAREAEEVHDLAVDPERTRDVFLEFAFAGALTAKALSAHAKGLARKHDADAAYELFLTLCVERTKGGLPPYTGMPEDLRRLAKAAKRDLRVEDERLLRSVLDSTSVSRASASFWKSYRDSLVALAKADDGVRRQLLTFVPASASTLDTWLEVLTDCGATRELVEPGGAAEAAEWLSSVLAVRSSSWSGAGRSTALLDLVEAMAARLVADGEPVRALRRWQQGELDLLDLMVSRGVPIAPSDREDIELHVWGWLADRNPGRRDLSALAASDRFVTALGTGLVSYLRTARQKAAVDAEVLAGVMSVPGLRSALRHWIAARAARTAVGLPALGDHLDELAVVRLPEAFADVPEAADALAATDVAAALHATLRAGLLDELGWPALEEAVARLRATGKPQGEDVVVCGEGWPALVLRRGETFVVAGPDGILAEHVSRIPADDRHPWGFSPVASWFDGVLLVRWHGKDGERAYWSDAPDHVFAPATGSDPYHRRGDALLPSIALPDGSRFAGGRAARPGDTALPPSGSAHGDGTSLWTGAVRERAACWVEVDPATGESGRVSMPRFLEDFAADGAALLFSACDLRPAVPATEHSPLGAAGGLHGWRVRREADGSFVGEGVDGRRVRRARGRSRPIGSLRLPGGGRLDLVGEPDKVDVLDEHGTVLGSVRAEACLQRFAAGTPLVPPVPWWHVLTPRDESGSAALRSVSRQAVEDMLRAAIAAPDHRGRQERLEALAAGDHGHESVRAIRAALPGLTHPALLAGVLDLVRRAADLLRGYRRYAEVAVAARAVDTSLFAPAGPKVTARAVDEALSWFGSHHSHRSNGTVSSRLPDLAAELASAVADPQPRELTDCGSPDWHQWLPHPAALAHRAASPLTPEKEREALALVLRAVADHGLADAPGHWRVVGVVVPDGQAKPKGRVTPVRDGFLALFGEQWRSEPGTRYDGLQFTRTPGTFALPRDWHVEYAHDVRTPFGGDRIRRFLDVLAQRGPAPWFPAAATALAERTGLGTTEAVVLLAGAPGVDSWGATYLSADERRLLGLSAAGARAAKERLSRLDLAFRRRLLAAAVPADPAELWTGGPDVEAVAGVWIAERGARRPVPDDVLADAAKLLPLRSTVEYVTGVLNPETTPWLTVDQDLRLEGTVLSARHPEGFGVAELRAVPRVLLWLAYRLPAGSPLRAALPEALDQARRRVADPGLAINFGGWVENESLQALLGIDPPPEGGSVRPREWLHVVRVHEGYSTTVIRPGLIGRDGAELEALSQVGYAHDVPPALDLLGDDGLAAACAVPVAGDPEAYHQDPAVSVPHLVAEVAAKCGLSEDAAVLYLQLLALPDPTDANVARWTGWKPARLRKARTALADTDLVMTAKRARAGRSLFLPGGWLALGSPHVPLEAWKAPMFGFTAQPTAVVVPREPVADLFARAWRRVLDGDAPAYEELKTGGRR